MNNTQKLTICVAILTWNRCKHVLKAIDSVYKQTHQPDEIVLVDSASTDGTVETIRVKYPHIKIINLHRNLGASEGKNIAYANCNSDIIYTLDDDGWLEENALATCINRFNQDPKTAIVASSIHAPDEQITRIGPDKPYYTFGGGASAIRRSLFNEVGYYPHDYFRQSEEGDLALRLLDKGYTILWCPESIMYHEKSLINRNERLFHYYNARNELHTIFRLYPARYVIPFTFQKIISWNLLGLKTGAVHYTIVGILAAIIKLPKLLSERKPVGVSTIKTIISMKFGARKQ